MKVQPTVLGQLLQLFPREEFDRIVRKYKGDHKTHKLDCWTQFVSLFYAQLRSRTSLRDIEIGLEAQVNKLYHLGMIQPIKRSTLSDANAKRDYRIYEESFQVLLKRCQRLGKHTFAFNHPLRILDSTFISLCHTLFPWATYRQKKGGLKLHLYYDQDNDLPEFITITEGKESDLKHGRRMPIKPDSILVFDRGYRDYTWLNKLNEQGSIFVTRTHSLFTYTKIGQLASDEADVLSDDLVCMPAKHSHHKRLYTAPIRLIRYRDPLSGQVFEFITNQLEWSALTIAKIYQHRWKIELFFKWIKQHFKIKTFVGTSKNAVLTQIWIAMITYLILWYTKRQTSYPRPLHTLTRLLNEVALERLHLLDILRLSTIEIPSILPNHQLDLTFS